jgi:hypothetical protein
VNSPWYLSPTFVIAVNVLVMLVGMVGAMAMPRAQRRMIGLVLGSFVLAWSLLGRAVLLLVAATLLGLAVAVLRRRA